MTEEEENNEEEAEEETAETVKVPKVTTRLDRYREEREKMEAANKKREEILDREELNKAESLLDGKANAGQIPEKTKEETPHEYRLRVEKELAEGKFDDRE